MLAKKIDALLSEVRKLNQAYLLSLNIDGPMDIHAAALYTGLAESTLGTYAREGKVKYFLIGGPTRPEYRFYRKDLDALLREPPDRDAWDGTPSRNLHGK